MVEYGTYSIRAKWRSLRSARASMLKKVLDTADIVRDGLFTATIHRVREAASLPLLEPTALLQWPDQPRNIHPNKPLLVVVGTDQVRGIVRYRQRGGVDWTLML